MKSNKLYSSLALIAFLLVFVAGTAKAQVFQTEPCDENSTNDQELITMPNGCKYLVKFCYDCPEGIGDQINIRLQSIEVIYTPGGTTCTDFIGAEEEFYDMLTSVSYFATLCPGFISVPPCGSGTWFTMNVCYPECNIITCIEKNGQKTWEMTQCDYPPHGWCIHTCRYCYNNGMLITDHLGVTTYSSGQCPSEDWTTITIPDIIGDSSPCFHACD